ncbi:MAG: 6-bladed beta-propeller, partial [Gammaproteobacteria bacterium]|nr:6-bladed beta-propeller [Gammaproteobacteria bacterium]
GDVFVADFYNDRVQKFNAEGVFLTAYGIKSTAPTHTAIAVAEADDGSVFVADYANHQVQKWQPGN